MSQHGFLLDVQEVAYVREGKTLLTPTSFTLQAGEFVHLAGPSGSGKSTLLKIIASLMEPTSGDIRFKGEAITSLKPETYRQQVSYCFQSPVLFGDTVYDNLAFPWLIRKQKVDRARLAAGLKQVNLPEDLLDKPIGPLSGGEKQRVALLRHLQCLPDILLLDEITSALDEENKRAIAALIAEQVREHRLTVIWISHDREELAQAQRVITLSPPAGAAQ